MSAIIEEALRNESVQAIYNEVNALTPISHEVIVKLDCQDQALPRSCGRCRESGN